MILLPFIIKADVTFITENAPPYNFKNDKNVGDYSIEGRRKNAERIRELCLWLDLQNIDVVCCILSIFDETNQWNRKSYSNYFEVFLDVPFNELVDRSSKNLYRDAQKGKINNVVGVDIEFNKPKNPDLILSNTKPYKNVNELASTIYHAVSGK